MRRDIVWERLDRAGLEHVTVTEAGETIRVESLVLLADAGGLIRLRYRLVCAPGWRTRAASFRMDRNGGSQGLEIVREGEDWIVDGKTRPDLAGCFDIDISATPLTNTMPVRGLGLAAGESRAIRVVYIRVPEMSVTRGEQSYTRLDPAEPPRRFRYDSPGFTAEVAFDEHGLVEDYPPGWRRRTA